MEINFDDAGKAKSVSLVLEHWNQLYNFRKFLAEESLLYKFASSHFAYYDEGSRVKFNFDVETAEPVIHVEEYNLRLLSPNYVHGFKEYRFNSSTGYFDSNVTEGRTLSQNHHISQNEFTILLHDTLSLIPLRER